MPPQKKDKPAVNQLLLIGLTGGIATGKSTVVRMLTHLGARVIDFDRIARKVVEPDTPAWREIVDVFGPSVLLKDRQLDRKALSAVVFRDPAKRKTLEKITHPRIRAEYQRQLSGIAGQAPGALVVVDVPLLIENRLTHLFDQVVLVYVPAELQLERLMKRDGIDRTEAVRRLDAQLPIEEKQAQADFVIRNDGPVEETRRQVEALWQTLLQQRSILSGDPNPSLSDGD